MPHVTADLRQALPFPFYPRGTWGSVALRKLQVSAGGPFKASQGLQATPGSHILISPPLPLCSSHSGLRATLLPLPGELSPHLLGSPVRSLAVGVGRAQCEPVFREHVAALDKAPWLGLGTVTAAHRRLGGAGATAGSQGHPAWQLRPCASFYPISSFLQHPGSQNSPDSQSQGYH